MSYIHVIFAEPYLSGMVRAFARRHFPRARIWGLDRRPGVGFDCDALQSEIAGKECLLFAGAESGNNIMSRMDLFSRLAGVGARLRPAVLDGVLLADDAVIGPGSLVYPQTIVDAGVRIGYNTLIGPNAVIETGCIIGNHCVIGANVILKSGTRVESAVYLAEGCHVGNARNFPEQPFITISRGVAVHDATRIRDDMPSSMMIDASVGDIIRVFR